MTTPPPNLFWKFGKNLWKITEIGRFLNEDLRKNSKKEPATIFINFSREIRNRKSWMTLFLEKLGVLCPFLLKRWALVQKWPIIAMPLDKNRIPYHIDRFSNNFENSKILPPRNRLRQFFLRLPISAAYVSLHPVNNISSPNTTMKWKTTLLFIIHSFYSFFFINQSNINQLFRKNNIAWNQGSIRRGSLRVWLLFEL